MRQTGLSQAGFLAAWLRIDSLILRRIRHGHGRATMDWATTRAMGEILWHRRETRRQTEKTNLALQLGERPVYSKPRFLVLRFLFDPVFSWAICVTRTPTDSAQIGG